MMKVNMATSRMDMRQETQTPEENGSMNVSRPGAAFLGFM